jgi:hypothetical protein
MSAAALAHLLRRVAQYEPWFSQYDQALQGLP